MNRRRTRGLLGSLIAVIGLWLATCGPPDDAAPSAVVPPSAATAAASLATRSPSATATATARLAPTAVAPPSAPTAAASLATPSPSPTLTATARPAPTPTPEPLPEAAVVRPEDFDADRFVREIAGVAPNALRVSTTTEAPDGEGTVSFTFGLVPAEQLTHLRLEIATGDQRVLTEIIGAGDQVYLRVDTGEQTIGWLTAPTAEGEESLLDFAPGAEVFDVVALQRDWTAEAVAPCRDDLTCFVLRSTESPGERLFIDVASYRPVLFTTPGADGAPPQEVNIDWNADVVIEIPSDVEVVTSDELGVAFLAMILSLAQFETDATLPVTPVAEAMPNATPATGPPPPPESAGEGRGRGTPFGFGQTLDTDDWRIEALEIVRGAAAWDLLREASRFNDPAPENREYVLVNLAATYTGDAEEDISGFSFRITGSSGQADRTAFLVTIEPELRATLRADGQTSGWVAFEVATDETRLILMFDPGFSFDDASRRYLALEPDASVIPDWDALPVETRLGRSRADPAPPGDTVTSGAWEVTVVEAVRGEVALQSVIEANSFNDPPPEDNEFILVRIRARNVSRADVPADIGVSAFRLTGAEAVLYTSPAVVDPDPRLDFVLFPGGSAEGWLTFQSRLTDSGLMLRFAPISVDEDDIRFLAIDPDAGVPSPPDPLVEPTDVGVEAENPVPLGDTAATDGWEIQVLEVVRGDDALKMATEASQFNDPPDSDMEYVQVRVRVRDVSDSTAFRSISVFSFKILGDRANIWDPPFMTQPAPVLSADLYPGGVAEGWMTLQAGEGETGLRLLYESFFDFDGSSRRYLALE